MIEVLELVNTCSSPSLSYGVGLVKKILLIIQIVGPIALIVGLSFDFIKLMSSPDDKKLTGKIKNSVIATVLLFLIPFFINLTMGFLGESFTITACWNAAGEYQDAGTPSGTSGDDERHKIDDGGGSDYEHGVAEPTDSGNNQSSGGNNQSSVGNNQSSSGNQNGNSPTSDPSVDGTATSIGDIVYDLKDITKISNITASQLTAVLSGYNKKSKNFIPYVNGLIATEHKYQINVFFLLGVNAVESGWCTSTISKNCNNLGGVRESTAHPSKGCGRNKGGGFAYFNTINDFLDYQGELLHKHYLTPGGKYYYGKTIEGVATKYNSSSQSWISQVKNISTGLFNSVKKVM